VPQIQNETYSIVPQRDEVLRVVGHDAASLLRLVEAAA